MSGTSTTSGVDPHRSPFSGPVELWIGLGVVSWAVALSLTTTPPLTNATTLAWTGVAVVVLAAMTVSLRQPVRHWDTNVNVVATAVTLGGWAVLMFRDDRWSVLTFVLFALCFAKARGVGLALAALVSAVWFVAWIDADAPTWRLLIPFASFAVGAIMSVTIWRVGDENESQAALIAQLTATRQDLAASERQRGTLEERARFAGEVHDTLAQGFTSIVLLSRATRRNEDWDAGLASIEATAEENLAAARRLVASLRPVELDGSTLADALQRELEGLGTAVDATFTVVGEPMALDTNTELALLRGAQEALLNVRTHAQASTVHMTLSYGGSFVALDVVDDGVGFTAGAVRDRGVLTGGQGLAVLRQRAETLGGRLEVEAVGDGGTAVSLQLPVGQT